MPHSLVIWGFFYNFAIEMERVLSHNKLDKSRCMQRHTKRVRCVAKER